MQTACRAAGQVVEIDVRRDPQRANGLAEAAGAGEERRVDRRRERAAVGRAWLVEVEVRQEGVRRDFVWDEVMEHEHVRLLQHLRGGRALAPEQQVGGDRALRGDVGDHQRLEA